MTLFEFLKITPSWLDFYFQNEQLLNVSKINPKPFYDTLSIKIVLIGFDEIFFKKTFLYSKTFETFLSQIKNEGFYPFEDDRICYENWTKQGIFFLNKDIIQNETINKLVLNHLKTLDVIFLKQDSNFTFVNLLLKNQNVFDLNQPHVFKKINQLLFNNKKEPIAW